MKDVASLGCFQTVMVRSGFGQRCEEKRREQQLLALETRPDKIRRVELKYKTNDSGGGGGVNLNK
jgi:hypothetical protein